MSDSTALAVVGELDSSLMYEGIGGDDQPLAPSNLKLLQAKDVEDHPELRAGQFSDTDSNMQFERIDVNVLQITEGRVLYDENSSFASPKVLCRSNDNVFPVIADGLIRQDGGRGCKNCRQSQWKKIGGRSIKPPCIETRKVLLAEPSTGLLYRFNVKGTAVPIIKDLKDTIKKFAIMAKAAKKLVYPLQYLFTLSSVKMSGNKGSWYVPKFQPVKPNNILTDSEQLKQVIASYKYYVNGKRDDAEQADDERATGADDAISGVVESGDYVQDAEVEYEAA